MSAICNQPLFPLGSVVLSGALNPQANGLVTLTINNATQEVLSVQPDGTWQTRPKGTAGPFELAAVNGNALVYNPNGQPLAYAYFVTVPNA